MIQPIKKVALAATTATLKKLQTYSETSFATLGKAAARCKIMEWRPMIALMILFPAAGMAIASKRSTECSTSAEPSQPDGYPSHVVGMSEMESHAPSTAHPANLSTGRISGGDISW